MQSIHPTHSLIFLIIVRKDTVPYLPYSGELKMSENSFFKNTLLQSSVPDSWRFAVDLDPRIRTTGLRIRIMLFSSVAIKNANKIFVFPPQSFVAYYSP